MRPDGLAWLGALLLAGTASAEVSVRSAQDGTLRVEARDAPLEDVLAAFSRETGLEVVYEGTPPRVRLTASMEDASSARALVRLLEGSGLGYALGSDASGLRAETLFVVANDAGPRRRPTAAAPTPEPADEPLEDPLGEEPVAENGAAPGAAPTLPPAGRVTPFDPTRPFQPGPVTPLTLPAAPGATPTPAPSREEVLRLRLEQLRQQREEPDPDEE